MGVVADVVRWSARLEESRTHEFDERLTVTDDQPVVTELRLARGGRVRYDCEVLDGKPVGGTGPVEGRVVGLSGTARVTPIDTVCRSLS